MWNLLISSKIFFDYINEDMFKYFYQKATGNKYPFPPGGRTWKQNCQFIDFNTRHILQYAVPFFERRGISDTAPNKSNWMDWIFKELQIAEPRMSYVCSRVYTLTNEDVRYSIIFSTQKTADLQQVTYQIGSIQFFSIEFAKEKSFFPFLCQKRDCQWSGQDAILGWCNVGFETLYESEGQQFLKTLLYSTRGPLLKKKKTEYSYHQINQHRQLYDLLVHRAFLNAYTWDILCDPLKEKNVLFNVKYNQANGKLISAQLSKKNLQSLIIYSLLTQI